MNSEQPQKPRQNFSDAINSDDMEIDVSYEEITPEEQQEIKQRVTKEASSEDNSQSMADIWLEDNEDNVEFTDFDSIDNNQAESEKAETKIVDSELEQSLEKSEELEQLETTETINPEVAKVATELETQSIDSEDLTSEQLSRETETSSLNLDTATETAEISETINPEVAKVAKELETQSIDSEAAETAETFDPTNSGLESSSQDIETREDLEADDTADLPDIKQSDNDNSSVEVSNTKTEPELIADSWLDESEEKNQRRQELSSQIEELKKEKASLLEEIKNLQRQKESAIAQQTQEIADNLIRMIEEGTRELKERKNSLLIDIEKLEKRRERIRQEMRTTFAGSSQDLAVRIQGFKQYLVGSLQELSSAAERLELPQPEARRRNPPTEPRPARPPREARNSRDRRPPSNQPPVESSQPQFTEQAFAQQTRRIRQLLDQYRTQPDYYGSPWQLRRTFEPIHAEKVQEWFFDRGGRGAIKGMGSRLQNILVASAIISVLYRLYRDRVRILVLVDTPEKLGEWRRGLQDCLGVSRNDFGSNRGIVLFESADVLVQRADRLIDDKLIPLIIIDEAEGQINLSLLKFPLWLAFAEKPQPKSSGYFY